MTPVMMVAAVLITLALFFYSVGVWSERFAGRLKRWHLYFFWSGLAFDTAGTGIMLEVAGGLGFDLHGVTGVLAIFLMIIHAIWATTVLIRRDEEAILNFHRFSVGVWTIWLVPYLSGFFIPLLD